VTHATANLNGYGATSVLPEAILGPLSADSDEKPRFEPAAPGRERD
jgi:hypothetical protein